MDERAAISYVTTNGSSLEKARLSCMLDGRPATAEEQKLIGFQNPDGGFPYRTRPGQMSSVAATGFAFTWLDDMNILTGPVAQAAARFLLTNQRPEGCFDESPALAALNPPAWMMPDTLPSQVFNTANTLYWLSRSGLGVSAALNSAADWLEGQQQPNGQYGGFVHSTWLSVAGLALWRGSDHPPATSGLDWLSGLALDTLAASQLSWMLLSLGACGYGRNSYFSKALTELFRRQSPDGSFGSEDGPAFAVHATLEAIRARRISMAGQQHQ
ncbi:MAG: terpene cyclase/mutase family protein [Bacillota bacterium]|nr:terpene cyclase/mutase family protein [Bacillota bacterium]